MVMVSERFVGLEGVSLARDCGSERAIREKQLVYNKLLGIQLNYSLLLRLFYRNRMHREWDGARWDQRVCWC